MIHVIVVMLGTGDEFWERILYSIVGGLYTYLFVTEENVKLEENIIQNRGCANIAFKKEM